MEIDKELWMHFHLREDHFPSLKCPTCGIGHLIPLEKFKRNLTKKSKKLINSEFSDQMDVEERFIGLLVCDREECEDVVTVCGTSFCEPDEPIADKYGYHGQSYYTYLKPEFFFPSIEIFPLKKGYPLKVKNQLKKSFSLYFTDYESCGNKIRNSIEELLTELGIKRYPLKGKRNRITLNKRIEEYKEKEPYLGELMLSIKWIGNFGSHSDSLKQSDLLDAYVMTKTILDKLFDNHDNKILKQAKIINKNKKPLSKLKNNNRYKGYVH